VSYFIDRVFAEAFFSPFGDRFMNSHRIDNYIEDQIERELEKVAIRDYIHEQVGEEIIEKFKEYNIEEGWYSSISNLISDLISFEGDKYIIERINKQPPLVSKKALEIWKQMDVLSIILGASREIRGNIDTLFKISYVLMVINRIELSKKIEIEEGYKKIVNLMDFTVFQYPNSLILEFKPIGKIPEESILEKFLQLLKKAISEEFTIDRTFSKEFSILETLEPTIPLDSIEFAYSKKITEMLLGSLFRKGSITREEAQKLNEIREQKGLSWYPFFTY
jgi:hypothetical protein